MPRISDKRERLLDAAKELIYQQGFNQTTLADIAQASDVPLGNVYYYFKTKDELAQAVIEDRQHEFNISFDQWSALPDPQNRLMAMLDSLEKTRTQVANFGCPIGSLCLELNKENSHIAPLADKIIKNILSWVQQQFKEMGCNNSEELATRFVVTLQGASMVANALHKPKIMSTQFDYLRSWINNIL